MTKSIPTVETLKELMTQYTENRRKWIIKNGSVKGFDAWFTDQVLGDKEHDNCNGCGTRLNEANTSNAARDMCRNCY